MTKRNYVDSDGTRLLTVTDMAAMMGVTKPAIHTRIRNGTFAATVRQGNLTLCRQDVFAAWLDTWRPPRQVLKRRRMEADLGN